VETKRAPITIRQPEAMPAGVLKPTGKQVDALAHELCARLGVEFPVTRGTASALIQRLRDERAEGAEV
jgi:hypothetical protein